MPIILASPANPHLRSRAGERSITPLDPVRVTPVPRVSHPNRADTPQRWQKALERALQGGLQLRQLMGSGAWIVTSEFDDEAAYMVTEFDCECFAAEYGDPVCKHRAMLRHRLGHLQDIRARLPEAA
jgi:hypothetical protein